MLVIDECHKLRKANKVNEMVKSIKTLNKFGLTGTLPDVKPDEWNVKGKLGNVIYDKDSFSLREEKHLTQASVSVLNVKYKTKPPKAQKNDNPFYLELDFIYENAFRNNLVCKLCGNFNNNSLVLVNHIRHGEALYDLLKNIPGKQVYFIRGDLDVEERDKIKALMEIHDNIVCIAISAIFSTGVNIKNIHMIMFAAGGKSSVRVIQSIGRGLRLNDNKDKLLIIDIADVLKYGKRHVEKRKEIYNKEKIVYKCTDIVEN